MYEKFIKKLENCSLDEVGSKAKRFKIIQDNTDYLVPETIIIISDFYKEIIDFNKISDPLKYNWDNLRLPAEFCEELFGQIKNIFGGKSLVIRSSASCEDSPILSFAGQYSSFLNIKTRSDIIKNILGCYRSLFSENALIYSNTNGINLKNQFMAIAIQEIITVAESGIIFTANPVTGSEEDIIIEYTHGSAFDITEGSSQPKRVYFKKSQFIKNQDYFSRLSRIALDIEKLFKSPQDIEWGNDGKNFYIFQSRPITTLRKTKAKSLFNDKDLRKVGSGIPVSAGQAIGKLNIIYDIKDIEKIKDGEIIFCIIQIGKKIFTKFPQIGGIITNSGLLSHRSIVLRELRIPCITEPKNFKYKNFINKNIYLDANKGNIFVNVRD